MAALLRFTEKWGKQYPSCVKSWNDNWDILSTFFAYPAELRRIIYTTNIIEGLNRQFRKVTKNKPSFTNDDSSRKMLYLASKKIVEHWTVSCRNWDMVLNQLNIMFAGRVPACGRAYRPAARGERQTRARIIPLQLGSLCFSMFFVCWENFSYTKFAGMPVQSRITPLFAILVFVLCLDGFAQKIHFVSLIRRFHFSHRVAGLEWFSD